MIQVFATLFKLIIWSINFKSNGNKSVTLTSTFELHLWIYFFSTQFKYNTSTNTSTDMAAWFIFFSPLLQSFSLHANAHVEYCAHLFNELFRVVPVLLFFLVKPNKVEYQMWLGFGKQNLWNDTKHGKNSVGADMTVHFQLILIRRLHTYVHTLN